MPPRGVRRSKLTLVNAVPGTMSVEVRDQVGRSALPDDLEVVEGRGVMTLRHGERQELRLPKGRYVVYVHGRYGHSEANRLGTSFERIYRVLVHQLTDPTVVFRVGMK